MSLTLTNIPKIMRSKGWIHGARLMESWFSRPSTVAPKYGRPDTSTIRMKWVLTYPRAKQVYDQLVRDKIWVNSAAQKEIQSLLQRQRLLSGNTTHSFGNPKSQQVQILDANYINYRTIGGNHYGYSPYYYYYYYYSSGLDDMTAALGRFAFRVIVAGSVTSLNQSSGSQQYPVTITDVGIYLRDSFDFNGDQFLGFWDDSDNSVSVINPLSGTAISNADF